MMSLLLLEYEIWVFVLFAGALFWKKRQKRKFLFSGEEVWRASSFPVPFFIQSLIN